VVTEVGAALGRDLERLESYGRRLAAIVESLDLGVVVDVVDELHDAWRRRALIAIAGNGGSASTASHMATDLVKATKVDGRPAVRALSLADNVALLTALANDDGYEVGFERQVEAIFRPGDVLVLISASGNSPNVVNAAQEAQALGGKAIALVGFDGGKLAEICDLVVHARSERGEYGPVEDVHLVLNHMITGCLLERIRVAEGI
jgi:D-sedoheptulose 7-phosphate isomerase